MTILEELIDMALKSCDNGRQVGQKQSLRGAAILDSNGRVYTGCDVFLRENDSNSISAEKAALIAAVSAGAAKIEVCQVDGSLSTVTRPPICNILFLVVFSYLHGFAEDISYSKWRKQRILTQCRKFPCDFS